MELIERAEQLRRQAERLARSAADLVAMAEDLRRTVEAQAGQETPSALDQLRDEATKYLASRANAVGAQLARRRPLPPANGDTVVIRRPAKFAEPERTDPVHLDAVIDLEITDAWNLDIFQVIEKLKLAGIPAVVRKSQVNGTNYIDVTHGDLQHALTPGATAMKYRWYGAKQ